MVEQKLYWCSWKQPTEDHRPIYFPPSSNILAWWKSGEKFNQHTGEIYYSTLCAWVVAEGPEDLLLKVQINWPEINDMDCFRFIEEKKKYIPNTRFPTEPYEWMNERLEKWK